MDLQGVNMHMNWAIVISLQGMPFLGKEKYVLEGGVFDVVVILFFIFHGLG